MFGKLKIKSSKTIKKIKFQIQFSDTSTDYWIDITIPEHRNIDTQKLKIGFTKYIKTQLKKNSILNNKDLFDNCNIIELGIGCEKYINLFQNENNCSSKQIRIEDRVYRVTRQDLKKAQSLYQNIPNVYIKLEENEEYITLDAYQKTVEIIYGVVDQIRTYHLSPLEEIMYAYDFARDRIYIEEEKFEQPSTSRDLTSVLLGNKIVCVGYAKILDVVLNCLGYTSAVYKIRTINCYHAINIVYLKDDTYNLNGIYFFDPTADRKIKESSNEYLDSYLFFAKTKKELRNCYEFSDETFGDFYIREYLEAFEHHSIFYEANYAKKWQGIMNINHFFQQKDFKEKSEENITYFLNTLDEDEVIDNLVRYNRLIDNPINTNKLLKALFRVRKIEYYYHPEKYELSVFKLKEIIENSSWNRDNSNDQGTNIFNTPDEYEKEIKQIKLTKILEKVKNNY